MLSLDSLTNLITGLGTSQDKSAATAFAPRVIGDNELEAMYRDDWIAKKIVNVVAEDMLRKGRQWIGEDDQIAKLEETEKRLGVYQKGVVALKWARLYGGAAIIVDDGGSPGSELNPEKVGVDRIKALHVVSRTRLTFRDGLRSDIRDEFFGQPKKYELNFGSETQGVPIHPSRVIPVHGEQTPDTDQEVDFWGDSVLRGVYDAVRNAATSTHGFAQLVHEAKIDIVSVENLASKLATTADTSRTLGRWSAWELGKSMNGVGMIDKDKEEHTQKQVNFANHDAIMMAFLVIVSGAADIPATRMLGQSPQGLNATGESDLRNYYNSIESKQSGDLCNVFCRLDDLTVRSALGSIPDDLDYQFRPLWTPTEKEQSEIVLNKAKAVQIYAGTAVVEPQALKEGVESMLIDDGTFPALESALAKMSSAEREITEPLQIEGPDEDDEDDEPEAITEDARPRPMYVRRQVVNAKELIAWAKDQGFTKSLPVDDLHVTVAYSKQPVDWMQFREDYAPEIEIHGGARLVEELGGGAVVLLFASNQLYYRWNELKEGGASWDWPDYQPHITITYDATGVDIDQIEPFQGKIVLGPEIFEEIEPQGFTPKLVAIDGRGTV